MILGTWILWSIVISKVLFGRLHNVSNKIKTIKNNNMLPPSCHIIISCIKKFFGIGV